MHLTSIEHLSENQLLDIYAIADQLKSKPDEARLRGKTFVLFFPDSSIRTRLTFEKGIHDLGGRGVLFPPETLNKREALEDVIRYIQNWADGVIVRHSDYRIVQELARYSAIPIINAMTSTNHPCEIMTDLYTISTLREDFRSLAYTFVGHAGNISRSWMEIAKVMDLKFNHVCVQGQRLSPDSRNYHFHTELEPILASSDVVLTDSLPDSLRTKEYYDRYQITLERMQSAKQAALLNPCPPFYRNEEVSEDAIESDYFVGHSFKRDLLYIQQAVMIYCCEQANQALV
ncbi:ornithine carbamoyltransferase [Cohnella cholangitidis]|uniref:Ornithine carbamoyltransferase n=1 Tax=Cohnella cholangitidis TaxID=2598458 RepID=A0A7G5C636_9BACL|nr:ornithine carbamoyltransferase [Cohnella cholangitidis]QMV44670.1 ornithine carbamoyltransferase [Cohnella cholangitidis]